MNNSKQGTRFEVLTRDFFIWIFDKVDVTITKDRIQTSGTQDGFDVQIQIYQNHALSNIYIECKDYSKSLTISNILEKAFELKTNHRLNNSNDLFIAINSKSNFKNKNNPEKILPDLNELFQFKCQLWDVSNGIKDIFALNCQIYKEIYGCFPDFEINEQKIIKRFKALIFSNKPLKKIILTKEDRVRFIGDLKPQEHFLSRTFVKNQRPLEYYSKQENSISFDQVLTENDKIFILGNPGAGKTTSLEQIAIDKWEIGEQVDTTPIFKNLKNFTSSNTIESILPSNYQEIRNVLLILDGIDEIADVENFISKLEFFLNSEFVLSIKLKCIISCRTNIYESIVKDITGFSTFFLEDLNYYESIDFLKSLCNSSINHLDFNHDTFPFLKNPFQLKILATYINTHNDLPSNFAVLWESYINERLKLDANEKQKKRKFDSILIKSQSQKVSLINELMKSNSINENLLFRVFNEVPEYLNQFKKNPLLEIIPGTSDWYFEHRNIQEYFAAKLISSQLIRTIISSIKILDTNKTHPSLFNSITFLINILDKNSEKYLQLINWLANNEPEILFKADSNRITEDLKINVFQSYFQRVCIEQTLWVNKNSIFNSEEISKFASCQPNYEYLISVIKDYKNYHFRTIYSALNLIRKFKVPLNKLEELKTFLIYLLEQNDFLIELKSEVVRIIHDQELSLNNKRYLNQIFDCFDTPTNRSLNTSLMDLLLDFDNIEDYHDFIREEFLMIHKLKPRENNDNVISGNNSKINILVLKINNPINFLGIIKYHFTEAISFYVYNEESYFNEVSEKLINYINKDNAYIDKLLSEFKEEYKFHTHEKFLQNIIIKTNTERRVIQYLLNHFEGSKVRYFLSSLINEENLEFLIEKLLTQKIQNKEIEYWRNSIGNFGFRSLSVRFHKIMKSKGIKFESPVFTEKKEKKQQKYFQKHIQENFNILFDKNKLKSKIRYLFSKYGKEIDIKMIYKIEDEWYKKNGHGGIKDAHISVLKDLIITEKNKSKNMRDVNEYLKNDFILFKRIKETIERYDSSNRSYNMLDYQSKAIEEWVLLQAIEIDFNKIFYKTGNNSFRYGDDHKLFKLVFFFQKKINIHLPKDFLLNSIRYFHFNTINESESDFGYLKSLVNDDKVFNSRVISNIKSNNLLAFSKTIHFEYALNNNLKSVFLEIRNFLRDKKSSGYVRRGILEKYISLTDDFDLIKELAFGNDEHLAWTSINIFMDRKKELELCARKAIEYLRLDEENYKSRALQILIILNHKTLIPNLIRLCSKDKPPDLGHINFNNFDNIEDLKVLKTLYNLFYEKNHDDFYNHHYRSFFKHIVTVFSKKQGSFEEIKLILNEIKYDLKKQGKDLFHINILIEDSLNSYINSKSSIYKFEKALETVTNINKV